MHGNNERAKTSSQRASRDDAFRQRARSSFFFVMCSSVCQYTFLSHIFFVLVAYTARPKTKERATSLSYSCTYTQQKSSRVFFSFFGESDKPDRKSLQQVMHGVKKKEKKVLIEHIYNKIMLYKIHREV